MRSTFLLRRSLSHRFVQVALAISLTVGYAFTLAAHAQAPSDADIRDRDDPPSRVARLSYLSGDVSLKPAGTDDWAIATLNRPLTSDDQLWLEHNARAELSAGSATIRLDENTAFSFSDLSDEVLQMRITSGTAHLTVRRLSEGEIIEIDTPQSAVTITRPGEYHVEVSDDGSHTIVKTFHGECEIAGTRESLRLHDREQVSIDGSRADTRERSASRNAFDMWAQERNQRYERSASAHYVDPDVIGYEDLDDYGNWVTVSEYGHVWYPSRVVSGWSPYSYGHWAWVAPWGWTWVDDAPWGFAPFHYGRWAQIHGRWGWVPGPLHVRAVYAPALVAWIGSPGPHIGISIGINVGWFPLAPREIFVPGYHCSRRHIQSVNYANTVIVNNVLINRAYVNRETHIDYINRGVRNAITVMPRESFINARPVHEHATRIAERDLRQWETRNVTPAFAPDRASTLGPRWNAQNSHAPQNWSDRVANREVQVRHELPPARTSFAMEQHAVRENNNRPVTRRDLQRSDNEFRPSVSPNNAAAPNNNRVNTQRDESRWPAQSPTQPQLNDASRNDRPRRVFDRSQETVVTPSSAAEARPFDRRAPQIERRVIEAPDPVIQPRTQPRTGERPLNVDRPRELERSQSIEPQKAPEQQRARENNNGGNTRRFEPPVRQEQTRQEYRPENRPERRQEQHQEPRQQPPPTAPPANAQREEQHHNERDKASARDRSREIER